MAAMSSPTRPLNEPRRGRPGYDQQGILAISVAAFNEFGYEATSMGVLAERLGLSKSAIYHHVESKEQLLSLALDQALGALEAVLAEPAAQTGSAGERLTYVIRRAVHVLVAELPSVTLLLRLRGNTEVERSALERRRRFDRAVSELVAAAAAEGWLRPEIDPRLAERLVFGMINSIAEWYRPDGDADKLADTVVAVAVDGLRAAGA
jgi:AcrR family transcriptional regulator